MKKNVISRSVGQELYFLMFVNARNGNKMIPVYVEKEVARDIVEVFNKHGIKSMGYGKVEKMTEEENRWYKMGIPVEEFNELHKFEKKLDKELNKVSKVADKNKK